MCKLIQKKKKIKELPFSVSDVQEFDKVEVPPEKGCPFLRILIFDSNTNIPVARGKFLFSSHDEQHRPTDVFTMMVKYSFLSLLDLLVSTEQQFNHSDIRKPVTGQVLFLIDDAPKFKLGV